MSCAAIIAVKGAATAKRRLAGVLPPATRVRFVATMLEQVLQAAREAHGVAGIVLVSDGAQPARPDVVTVLDEARGLDAAFVAGARAAGACGYRSAVLLPADLPLLEPGDLDGLIKSGCEAGVAIACDRAGEGTNALYLPLELPIALAFGRGSCARHHAACVRIGLRPALVCTPGLALDIDEPRDLEVLCDRPAYAFLPRPARSVA